jgi:molybdopterin-guanine dinucleotide biosynthesis protein A/nucleoside-triphosphatase THEP1
MPNQIFILSQPIKTGKTTLLKSWVETQQNVGGILTPDVNNTRMLYNIAQKTFHPLQTQNPENSMSIGRFLFDKNGFVTAQNILSQCLQAQYNWVIVDEVGRLEMDNKSGLEPTLTQVINAYKNHQVKGNLLLVVRDYLLHDAINYYQIPNAKVLTDDFFKTETTQTYTDTNNLTGLVLCGGQSVRMGRDKAFITYHSKPQYAHVADMLQPFCNDVYISCNAQQKNNITQYYKYIEDNATYKNAGPLTGVLSAFKQLPQQGLLVIGCDYPYLNRTDIKALLAARQADVDVVCFKNTDTHFEEPLLAIYEKQCASLLLQFYQNGQQSLRHFIKTVNHKTVTVDDNKRLMSVDFN